MSEAIQNPGSSKRNLAIVLEGRIFGFSNFDKGRVVFKNADEDHEFISRHLSKSHSRALCNMLSYETSIRFILDTSLYPFTPRRYEPVFFVGIRGELKKTGIPAPRISADKKEFSFEWKGMLTKFLIQQVKPTIPEP